MSNFYRTMERISSPLIVPLGIPVPKRCIIPFSLFVLLFSGFGIVVRQSPSLSLIWTVVLGLGLVSWFVVVMLSAEPLTLDFLGIGQFILWLFHLVYLMGFPPQLNYLLYLILIALLIVAMPPQLVPLLSLQVAVVVLFQELMVPLSISGSRLFSSAMLAFGFFLVGFILSFVKEEDTLHYAAPLADKEQNGAKSDADDFSDLPQTYPQEFDAKESEAGDSFADDADNRIESLLSLIYDHFSPVCAIFFALDREKGLLFAQNASGGKNLVDFKRGLELGKGAVGWCAGKQLSLNWTDAQGERPPYYRDRRMRVRSILAVPVYEHHFPVGVLAVDSFNENAFTYEDQRLMEFFSSQLSLILDVLSIHREKVSEAREYELINQFGNELLGQLARESLFETILRQLRQLVRFDTCFIMRFNDETQKLELQRTAGELEDQQCQVYYDINEGLAGWVMLNRRHPHLFLDAHKVLQDRHLLGYGEPVMDVKSILFIPLPAMPGSSGLILLTTAREGDFKAVNTQRLNTLANLYSLALSNAEKYEQLKEMSITDGLTKLLNHRCFQDKLEEEFRRFERDPRPVSLIILDIDHFKKFNDTYGHPVGDQVLKWVAQLLKKCCREIDSVARYGGEEFAVILVNTDREGAMMSAERIRQTIAQDTLTVDELSLSITVSVGVATYPVDCQSKQELIDNADQALYRAKEGGRNRVVQAEPLSEES